MSTVLAPALLALTWLQTPAAVAAPPAGGLRTEAGLRSEAAAEVVRVVDGDTLEVRLDGELVSLRLSSVDTEEKIAGRASLASTKPETVFGEETAQWARAFFADLGPAARVGLAFPEGRRTDAYGRLLCHVILPDGRDFNLLLVELGKSPYFNKYGNSPVAHGAFVRAQAEARAARRGIWDPATNRARSPGAPSAVRPYERLLPWWDARAAAIDAFRARAAAEPERWLSAEDPAALARGFERGRRDPALRVTVFATIERFYEEPDGSLTALLRSGGPESALRAQVSASTRAGLEPRLRASTAEFRQNYWNVTGRLERNARGFVLTGVAQADWHAAEPAFPAAAEPHEPK